MKSLKDFKNEEIELSSVTGGLVCRTSTAGNKPIGNGCYQPYKDSYVDKNGDGVWNATEYGELWNNGESWCLSDYGL